jgi:hypothetical protein
LTTHVILTKPPSKTTLTREKTTIYAYVLTQPDPPLLTTIATKHTFTTQTKSTTTPSKITSKQSPKTSSLHRVHTIYIVTSDKSKVIEYENEPQFVLPVTTEPMNSQNIFQQTSTQAPVTDNVVTSECPTSLFNYETQTSNFWTSFIFTSEYVYFFPNINFIYISIIRIGVLFDYQNEYMFN